MFKLFTNAYLNAHKIFVKSPKQINAMSYLFRSIMKTEKINKKRTTFKSSLVLVKSELCVLLPFISGKKTLPLSQCLGV